jgi:GNAT superfamily N-acetyltransferase
MTPTATIRTARRSDEREITRLSAVLGYPVPPEEMGRRLDRLLSNAAHYVAVVDAGSQLAGWMHVEHRVSLEGGERAELMGLVVDASARRAGWGRRLVAEAEGWAAARRLPSITVRSNATRRESHPFYLALGYALDKTQRVYVKSLAP